MDDQAAWSPGAIARRRRVPRRVGAVAVADAALLTAVVAALLLLAALLVAREAGDRERRAADRRLTDVAEAAAAEFVEAVADIEARVRTRATDATVVRALARGDTRTLTRVAAADRIAFARGGRVVAGRPPGPGDPLRRSADVVGARGTIGTVLAGFPADGELVARLERAAQARPGERVVIAVDGEVVAGAARVALAPAAPGRPVTIADGSLRAVTTTVVSGPPVVRVAAVTNAAAIDERADQRRNEILIAIVATIAALALLVTAALVWVAQRRSLLRERAVAYERRNVRDALSLVGDALASTHDTEALLPVIVQTALEAAGATGARLLRDDQEVVRAGRPSASKSPLVLPLGVDDDGRPLRLLLYAPGPGPPPEARELAEWFVSQAAIALENARLHGIVKRQAITDPLTGLANRRRFVEALEAELSRAERFETDLAVVIADLDDFKTVNDSFGHEAGNDVLRAFATLIDETLRDVDVAARLGGEEFAMLLPQTDLEGALALSERIRAALEATSVATGDAGGIRVTGSFGVAAYTPSATTDTLLRTADAALYRAKAAGKNRVSTA